MLLLMPPGKVLNLQLCERVWMHFGNPVSSWKLCYANIMLTPQSQQLILIYDAARQTVWKIEITWLFPKNIYFLPLNL